MQHNFSKIRKPNQNMFIQRLTILFLLISLTLTLHSQQNDEFRQKLDSISKTVPALNEKIDFTVNQIPLHEFIRGIANEAGLNVSLDPGLSQPVSNNFSNVQVKDLLVFVRKNYNVEIEIIGNILNIQSIPVPVPPKAPSVLVDYDSKEDKVSLEINDASIEEVAREITRKTGQNLIAKSSTKGLRVRTFIKDMPFFNAIQKMAVANDFKVSKSEDGFYILESEIKNDVNQSSINQGSRRGSNSFRNRSTSRKSDAQGFCVVNVHNKDSIDVEAENANVAEVVRQLFTPLNMPYQFIGEIDETVTIEKKGEKLNEILEDLFVGLKVAIRKVDNTYWIGARDVVEMNEVKMVQMRYRSIDSLQYVIPTNLKEGVEIIDYPDLNSLILAGSSDRINALTAFLKEVDKLIPVVLIEVIIVDNNDSKQLSTGITAGLSEEAVKTSGTILPSANVTLGANSINKLIDGFNGLGWVNLGKVKSNFYMTLNALDENGYVDIKSTPQLATMNGHKASMSIGRTEYYKEELNTLYGTVTSSSQTTTTYKPVEADLKLEIKPIVSGNQDITLQIKVEQSDFTERIEENAPPGKVTRMFESLIRIKDQEMILLGGLEEAEKRDTRSGFPLLSRIPILNWIFSSKTKAKSEGKLNIFIKPTIIN